MSYEHRWPTIQKWQELLGQHRKFETIPIWSQPYFYMLVIHRQETTHREKLKHFPRAKLLSNLHSLSYNQTFLSHKPLQNLFTQTLQEPSTEPTQHTIFDLMYVFILQILFQIVSNCTSKKPPHFKPHCNVRPLMVPGLGGTCQIVLLLTSLSEIRHMTYDLCIHYVSIFTYFYFHILQQTRPHTYMLTFPKTCLPFSFAL